MIGSGNFCGGCGHENLPDSQFCGRCGTALLPLAPEQDAAGPAQQAVPVVPAPTPATDIPAPAAWECAGFWLRSLAFLIDGVFLLVVLWVLGMVLDEFGYYSRMPLLF